MRVETATPYTNVIPRVRDKDGDPVPRHFVYSPPVLTHDAEAMLEAGTAARESPEDAKRLVPWLLCWNAVAASENVKRLRQDMADSLNERNDMLRRELSEVQDALKQARQDETERASDLAAILAPLGIALRPSASSLELGSDEPCSLEELAGQHGLPSPSQKPSALYGWLHKLVAVIGGGTVFGLSLGLLIDKLELASIGEELPLILLFVALGIAVMYLVGSVLTPLATSVGGSLYRLGVKSSFARNTLPWLYGFLLIGLAVAFVVIESKVEQVGLFKGLVESSSLSSMKLTKLEMGFVALTLSLPIVASYVCLGLMEGERKANLTYLAYLQAKAQDSIRQDPRFAEASRLFQHYKLTLLVRTELEEHSKSITSSIRETFTLEELRRLEDQEMDAAGISYAAERALLGQSEDEPASERRSIAERRKYGRLGWLWTRLKKGWT
ncbi:MAG: hypothetical protein KF784_11535 [Fimbriimonadaceae bacterium]|nr:hypothetical protein [Fimbriimonadaceae bacterium]